MPCFYSNFYNNIEMQSRKDAKRQLLDHNQVAKKMFSNGKLINGCALTYDTSFGINSNPISNHTQIVGDRYIIFMTGNIVVVKDLVDKSEKFIAKEGRFNCVTALFSIYKEQQKGEREVGRERDREYPPLMIFLGESSETEEKSANIVLYETFKSSSVTVMNTGIKGVIKHLSVNESKDMVGALIQSSQQMYVSFWNYRKERMITNSQVKGFIDRISIHPSKTKEILLMGKNYLRLWELHHQENVFKESHTQLISLKTEKQNKFHDYAWSWTSKTYTLYVLTSGNKVLIIQNDVLVHTLTLDVENELLSIASTKKGFVVGGANSSLLIYQMDKTFNINNVFSTASKKSKSERIIKIHTSANDGIMILTTVNNFGAFNYHVLNSFKFDAEISAVEQLFIAGFHNKKVNQLSASITKQLVASCSQDNTVKIWNFFEHQGNDKRGILSHHFEQEPLSISLHPSGLFVAVGFSSGFKVFAIVHDTLVVLKQTQIPNCRFIKYSHGGHFLLVNQKQHIFIYDSIYYQTLHLFSLTSNVEEVAITHDDLFIVATCSSGHVFCFSIFESTKVRENYQSKKGYEHQQPTIYNCIGFDDKIVSGEKSDSDLFIGCSIEKYMCLYKNKCKDLVCEFPIVDCHITSLFISRTLGVLFVGTSKGDIRTYLWPLQQINLELEPTEENKARFKHPEFMQIKAHCSPVTSLQLSHDQTLLFSGGEDGTILCFKIDEKSEFQKKEKGSLIKNEDRKRIAQSANDLYLQRIEKIEEKNEMIKKLKFEVVRSEQKLKLEKEKLEILYKQRSEALKKQFNATLETDKHIKESYIQNSKSQYNDLLKKLSEEENKYNQEITTLQEQHRQKLEYEENRNKQLELEIEALHQKHREQLSSLKQNHQNQVKSNRRDFFKKCQQLQVQYSNYIDKSSKYSKDFVEGLQTRQRQYQHQIQDQIKQKKQQIAKIKSINADLQKKNLDLTTEYNNLKRQDQDQQNLFQKLFKQHNNIRFDNLKNDQDILKMQHQLLERLQVIDSKEQTCKNARYQQTTLENFRYMLDSKIQSLQQKKREMMRKIELREEDLKNMFNELIKESEENEKKYFELKQLNAQIQVLESEVRRSENEIGRNNSRLKNFQNQLAHIIKSDDDIKIVSRKLHALLEECKKEEESGGVKGGKDKNDRKEKEKDKEIYNENNEQVYEELSRQAKWMNRKLNLIKSTAQNYKEIRQDNINTILGRNTKLIQECNQLRRSNQVFKRDIKKYQKELAEYMRRKEKIDAKKKMTGANLAGLNKKLLENEVKISNQQNKLETIDMEMKEILKRRNILKPILMKEEEGVGMEEEMGEEREEILE